MRLTTDEFVRRFLIHVLPASSKHKNRVAKVRALLSIQSLKQEHAPVAQVIPLSLQELCPDCGIAMRTIEIFRRGQKPQSRANHERRQLDEM